MMDFWHIAENGKMTYTMVTEHRIAKMVPIVIVVNG
jgi:hypothetical protein